MAEQQSAMLSIPYKKSGLSAYRTCASDQPRAAIILIHEAWGLTDHIKDVAQRLCREGYEVVAPDLITNTDVEKAIDPSLQKILFDPIERPKYQVQIRAMLTPLSAPEFAQETIGKLKAVFDYLKNDTQITKIAVVGFCFGGTYSFGLAASQKGLAAAVPFYGHGEHYIDQFNQIDCPILAFYGEKDVSLNEHIPAIEQAMDSAGNDFTYHIYPDAGHAFFNDTNALAYNQTAAADAWHKTLEFLASSLS